MKDWGTAAHDALVKAGAIKPCRHHFDIFLRTQDEAAESHAYALATNMLKYGDVAEGPRRDFMELVSDTLERTPDNCFICEAYPNERPVGHSDVATASRRSCDGLPLGYCR